MAEQPPIDPGDHAEDFSRRYDEDMDIAAGHVLLDLGIDPNRIGANDPDDDFKHKLSTPAMHLRRHHAGRADYAR